MVLCVSEMTEGHEGIEKDRGGGFGEVGKPLLELVSERHEAVGVDLAPTEVRGLVDVLQICTPYEIPDLHAPAAGDGDQ